MCYYVTQVIFETSAHGGGERCCTLNTAGGKAYVISNRDYIIGRSTKWLLHTLVVAGTGADETEFEISDRSARKAVRLLSRKTNITGIQVSSQVSFQQSEGWDMTN